MKKFIVSLLITGVIFTMSGCGNDKNTAFKQEVNQHLILVKNDINGFKENHLKYFQSNGEKVYGDELTKHLNNLQMDLSFFTNLPLMSPKVPEDYREDYKKVLKGVEEELLAIMRYGDWLKKPIEQNRAIWDKHLKDGEDYLFNNNLYMEERNR